MKYLVEVDIEGADAELVDADAFEVNDGMLMFTNEGKVVRIYARAHWLCVEPIPDSEVT